MGAASLRGPWAAADGGHRERTSLTWCSSTRRVRRSTQASRACPQAYHARGGHRRRNAEDRAGHSELRGACACVQVAQLARTGRSHVPTYVGRIVVARASEPADSAAQLARLTRTSPESGRRALVEINVQSLRLDETGWPSQPRPTRAHVGHDSARAAPTRERSGQPPCTTPRHTTRLLSARPKATRSCGVGCVARAAVRACRQAAPVSGRAGQREEASDNSRRPGPSCRVHDETLFMPQG